MYLLFLYAVNHPTVVCTTLHLQLSSPKEFHNRSISALPQVSQTCVDGFSFLKQLIDLFPSKRDTCSLYCVSRSASSNCLVFLDTVKSDPILDLILHLKIPLANMLRSVSSDLLPTLTWCGVSHNRQSTDSATGRNGTVSPDTPITGSAFPYAQGHVPRPEDQRQSPVAPGTLLPRPVTMPISVLPPRSCPSLFINLRPVRHFATNPLSQSAKKSLGLFHSGDVVSCDASPSTNGSFTSTIDTCWRVPK